MRPLRLDVEGYGTFRDPVSLNFSDTDFFALVGPTGSGKTTVIDAICFALYGSAPRWPRSDQISMALAPSTSHARVTLVFRVAGRTYAASRTLARAARGQVNTKQSRLILLPSDVSLEGDLAELLDLEQEALAESQDSMTTAVTDLLGLTFEHFKQCVVLPQGDFAQFLHAKKAERQKLLVSLLGLSVYERVMQRANQVAKESGTRAGTLRDELATYDDATAAAETAAKAAHQTLAALDAGLDDILKPWQQAEKARVKATETAAGFDDSLATLGEVVLPDGLEELASEREAATADVATADEAETAADQAVEQAEAAVAETGEGHTWKALLDAHARAAQLTESQSRAREALEIATSAAEEAEGAAAAAEAQLLAARTAQERERVANLADDLATTLHVGDNCPVCQQEVARLSKRPAHKGLGAAKKHVTAAESALKKAQESESRTRLGRQRAVDEVERLDRDLVALASQLDGQPDAAAAAASYGESTKALANQVAAQKHARSCRDATRKARDAVKALDARWLTVGQRLTQAREQVLPLGPPATSGDHLTDWASLVAWCGSKVADLTAESASLATKREEADRTEVEARGVVVERLREAGVVPPAAFTEVTVRTESGRAVDRTLGVLEAIRRRRKDAARLEKKIKAEEDSEVVHRELGNLLNARNFERWILEEALGSMMVEASGTLSELSGGQFELVIDDKQDILVVDHNDASSHRPMQTLSGGETFQASLSLALALSSQIAVLSPHAGQLDTILLDEGFGTLDSSTLDVVASALEQLAGGGERTVGVVTHVGALAERAPVQFQVTRQGSRSHVEKVWT